MPKNEAKTEAKTGARFGENPLLVHAPGRSGCLFSEFLVLDHPILDGIRGHFQPWDFEKFYTNEMHDKVVEFLCKSDLSYDREYSRINEVFMDKDDIKGTKRETLTQFFWSDKIGSREPKTGEIFRGTILFDTLY